MELTKKILKRFIKDFNLPIQCIEHFNYFVNLYDNIYDVRSKLKMLEEVLKYCSIEEDFFEFSEGFSNDIINFIKSRSTTDTQTIYDQFQKFDMNKYSIPVHSIPRKDIFNPNNDGKYFVSLDLNKANFQSMKFFNPALVGSFDSWEELVKELSHGYKYYTHAKRYRQVVFGNLNPKRQMTIQKFMTWSLVTSLIDNDIVNPDKYSCFVFFNVDEIVIEYNDMFNIDEVYSIVEKSPFDFSVEVFKLHQLKPYNFYVKEFLYDKNSKVEFKCIPAHFFPQVYKRYFKLDLIPEDLDFYYEKKLAHFHEPLKWE